MTQPAVSLQIRSLEQRLGRQLLDRSGRRVEPTEAGLRLYPSAQRLLALEEQLVEEVAAGDGGRAVRPLDIGASTGPGGAVVPVLLCQFQQPIPACTFGSPSPTRRPSSTRSPSASSSSGSSVRPAGTAASSSSRSSATRSFSPARPATASPGDRSARRAPLGAADRDAGRRRCPSGDRGRAARRRHAPARSRGQARARPPGIGPRAPSPPGRASPSSPGRRSTATSLPGRSRSRASRGSTRHARSSWPRGRPA